MSQVLIEKNHQTMVAGSYDIIVAGGGPAGVSAAIAAARKGARTLLVEPLQCLGSIWTAGQLGVIVDSEQKGGIVEELKEELTRLGAGEAHLVHNRFMYDPEVMKYVLEKKCQESVVQLYYSARVTDTVQESDKKITHIITESVSGREAWNAELFIDATGDGTLSYLAGCDYAFGNEDGVGQPMSMLTRISGVNLDEIRDCVRIGNEGKKAKSKRIFQKELEKAGVNTSIGKPALFPLSGDSFILMGDHQYEKRGSNTVELTEAIVKARQEIWNIVSGLKSLGGRWKDIYVASFPDAIGVREGRRISGLYTVTKDDIKNCRRHKDGICRVMGPVDVHSLKKEEDKVESDWSMGVENRGYDIPLRALITKDVPNLFTAGRCISGDFTAHSSYRVTGDASVLGESAGIAAAACATGNLNPGTLDFAQMAEKIQKESGLF